MRNVNWGNESSLVDVFYPLRRNGGRMEETPKIMEKDSRLRVKMRCLSLKFRSWIDPVRCVACGLRATKWFSKHTLGRQWETYFVNFKAQLSQAMWLWGTYLSFWRPNVKQGLMILLPVSPGDLMLCLQDLCLYYSGHVVSTELFMPLLFSLSTLPSDIRYQLSAINIWFTLNYSVSWL